MDYRARIAVGRYIRASKFATDLGKLKGDCCVSSHMSQFGQCGVLGHAVSNSSLMNWISPLTPDVLLWIWPRLIVRIVSIPLRVALADRSDRKL